MKKKNTSTNIPLSPALDFNKVNDETFVTEHLQHINHELAWRHYLLRISGNADEHEILQIIRSSYEKQFLTASDLNNIALQLLETRAFQSTHVNRIVTTYLTRPHQSPYANKPFARQIRKWQLASAAYQRTGNAHYLSIKILLIKEFYEMGLFGNPGSPLAELRYEMELTSE